MSKHKVLILFCIILITYSVTCDDAEEIKRRGLTRARQKYRYNHPPEPENYESIPVAIVYDKVTDRTNTGRNVRPTIKSDHVASTPIPINSSEVTSIPEINTEGNISTEHSVNDAHTSTEIIRKPEPREITLEYKIPVSVVYDEEPRIVRRNRIKPEVSTRVRKPTRKQEKPSDESIKQSQSPLSNTEISDLSPFSRITEQNTPVTVKQDEEPRMIIRGAIQESEYIDQEKPSRFINKQNGNEKVSGEDEIEEKKRIHGEPDPIVPIVASENHVFGHNGEFHYSYEGGDGTRAFSKGQLKTFDEVAGEAVEGGFSYKDRDGNDFSLSYTADENGYRPVGAHLPTPPPIPPAIARALAYLATKTTPEPVTEPFDYEENTPDPNKAF